MYKIIRNILFWFSPEWVHYFSMNLLRFLCVFPGVKKIMRWKFGVNNTSLQRSLFGINFPNPVGLGAGFDKNARYLNELQALGFGFIEIGTVTPLPQLGNEKPRLFRLPKDKALINRMGFNNDGVKIVADRLKDWKSKNLPFESQLRTPTSEPPTLNSRLIIGGNIGKNKITPNEDAWKDYEICFAELFNLVDYFVVNVSSPNTPDLRALQEKESLRKILSHLQTINRSKINPKPLLLKIAPDLSWQQIDDIIELAMEIKLDGLVATNTTIDRSGLTTPNSRLETIGMGGLSGLPVKQRSTEIVQYIHQKTKGQLPVIASGGVFSGADAKEKLQSGASLVQVWTGFIYEGPGIVKQICDDL
jgi:dihydroorotate dehydrogenase